ncbi:MAG: FtsX-like permease family protein [Bacteroidetes bacterium]|nr:MAG: FtsX-like permease family protein [Bacteroidota bacterium]
MDIDSRLSYDSSYNEVKRAAMQQLLLAMKQMPEIENVAAWAMPPYSNSQSSWSNVVDGREVRTRINHGSEEAKDVLGLQMVEGRWFEPGDKALNWKPLVINNYFSKERFGNASPLGKDPFKGERHKESGDNDYRVIGVVSEFRKDGEFSEPMNHSFEYLDIEKTTQVVSSTLLLKMQPGTELAFEEKLVKTLEAVAKDWSFDVKPLEDMRKADFKPRITSMIVIGLIAGFLLLMVALGLIGVLWQNVSRRTQEIGLRRALGSTEKKMYGQIIGELLVLTTFGLLIGAFIIVQFPLLELINFVPPSIYVEGFLVSVILMYLLTFFSALYPSWLTMGIEPAEALHYE